MPSCAVITCRARSQAKDGISFHRFPKEADIRKQWIDATGREDWIPTKLSTICSKHFTQKDYAIKNSGNKYLIYGAIPHEKIVYLRPLTVNDAKSSSSDEESDNNLNYAKSSKLEVSESTKDHDDDKIIKREIVSPVLSTSGTIAVKERVEERLQMSPCLLHSNKLTPSKAKLKQIITTKEAVITRQRKQIKKIQTQNRRLKKKVFMMQDIINKLEKKDLLRHEDLSTLKRWQICLVATLQNIRRLLNSSTYPRTLRTFALALHYYSPKAYNYVLTYATLKWYSTVDGEPGFTSEPFTALNGFLGISVKTVSRITKEAKIAASSSKKIVTPRKSRPQPKKIKLDDFD